MKKQFLPDGKYLLKLRLSFALLIFFIGSCTMLLAWPIGVEEGATPALIYAGVVGGIAFIVFVTAMLLSGPYANSRKYEIHEDEVIVRAGIITK